MCRSNELKRMLECGRLRSKMQKYKTKKEKAIQLCCECLENYEKSYVALSGGKDSVALSFIVNEASKIIGKDFSLWTHLSDASFPGTKETCEKVSEMINKKIDFYISEKSAFDDFDTNEVKAFGKSGVFFDSVRKYAKDKDLCFTGVRAGESKRRMKAAKAHGSVFLSKSMGNVKVANPLQWFDLYDVFGVLQEFNAPIHPIYNKIITENGMNANKEEYFIRLSYATSKDLWNKGTMYFIKVNYPELYGKMKEKCPDISRFT